MAAEHGTRVGEALHVTLEGVDAPREEQVAGIEPATDDRRADPAPATTRVRRVEQAAVPAHEPAQARPGALESLAERGGRDLAHRGRLVARVLEHLAEHVGHPMLAVE